MIELRDINLSFGPKKIFDSVGAVINRRDRIGLVGSNGAGKSTLLKFLAGIQDVDSGVLSKPKYATIGYLPQEGIVAGSRPLFEEAESAFENVIGLRAEMELVNEAIGEYPSDSPEYADAVSALADIQEKLSDAEESKIRPRVETVLQGLGFGMSDMRRPCSEFSGGWQMRVALAKLLLKEPALLMLDEPTNHLDIESVAWLEDWLASYAGAVLLVSHDKAFLDRLCTRTFHLSRGKLETYSGNYEFYLRESAARRDALARAAANQKREIAKTEKFIERFRYKSSKAAQVQSRIKALEKIDRIDEPESEEGQIHFAFPPAKRCGQLVLEVKNLSKSFSGKPVFSGVSFSIERGERVALVGVNGAGKSTLAKIIAGELAPDSGETSLGLNVEMSYFAQHQTSALDPSNDVLTEALEAAPPSRKGEVRSLLGSFMFSGDDALKCVGVLSGGEKNRLALAKMLLKEFNFLLLDEPTNHLDMASKRVLQKALDSYDGTFLIVSHDRDFLDPIVGRVLELSPAGLRQFPGNLSDYVERISSEGKIKLRSRSARKVSARESRRKEEGRRREALSALKRSLRKIEESISQSEADLAADEEKMSSPDFFKRGDECQSVLENYKHLKERLDELYSEWERIAFEIENAAEASEKS